MRRWAAIAALAACGGGAVAGRAAAPADFATRVLAYNGVNGVNGYTAHPEYTLGAPSVSATPDAPDNSSVFSFGWGGFVTLGFDRPIVNDTRHAGGFDFIVFGNALYVSSDTTAPYREPGYVEVGVDPSGGHQYGDGSTVKWYWLKGVPAPSNLSGFPISVPAYGDTTVGYADCTPTEGTGDPLVPSDPTLQGITPGSAGGDAFDLAWATDANGAPVTLPYADFVRITCAVNSVSPHGGGIPYSTEVDAVSLVRPRVPGDVDFDNSVTLEDACLVARAVGGKAVLTDEQILRADPTGHGGAPTLADAARILRVAAGIF